MAGPEAKGRGQREKRPTQKVKDNLEAGDTVNPSVLSQPAESDVISSTHIDATVGPAAPEMLSSDRSRKRPAPSPAPDRPFGTKYPESEPAEPTISLPSYSPKTTRIYAWPCPSPKSFVALKPHERRWKADLDAADKSQDVDDGLEEWEYFAVSFVPGGDNKEFFSAVGSVFIKRAKRAFWAGKSWAQFEVSRSGWRTFRRISAAACLLSCWRSPHCYALADSSWRC